ncbi:MULTISPECIES: potassium-transporting ATPase subunit KdpB [Corynebacterium]|uniref:potassium-transporting ATPase subunit KdpB n=1 Tax=Corynebacterium TaxID=1716 RepID=UPI0003B8C23D|nr:MULTISPECIES: potassium-transporting ATPase subunit KdpB [Corynebacterium]WKS53350.1 potassium-transporting ATPase subunit KdpB [Corynebacterium tuberculostearicum]ERS50151.1 K+-transporting ATPase, B subunit [Corynebacterium sp. KPL1856]ERS50558.1 K+-transporting ATPase, B subunit [Corynebacterium sp. KPL1860]ERS55565.1 K+-transporting ATPase, B subunit [Corynebacterium sp. KPL1821]ERS61826.1 K+-transporting ATPase, B subunit [Corynebacterium sp. KPL1817]
MTTPTMTTERRTPQRSATTNSGLAAAALKSLPHKTSPLAQARNPVMFVVWVGAALTTLWSIFSPSVYGWVVTVWLWFTIAFAAFAEAYAEGRGKAQADSLRAVRDDATANLVTDGGIEVIAASELTKGAIVRVEAGETIPGDGDVIEGAATVDESAITGESAPVVREAGGDRCAVTGGTVVLSDSILVRITSEPGSTFVDTMIALVEGAERRKTPNEIALSILLSTLTILFLIAVTALAPMGLFTGAELSPLSLVALLVCLIPTTIAALLSAVGIAGMNRLVHHNVLATSGRAVEAAGDVATLLMDKTGTITYGNRQATGLIVARGVDEQEAAEIARVASVADETPEGRSIVLWLTENYHLSAEAGEEEKIAEVIPFSASTRMSGLDLRGRKLRKGAGDAVRRWVTEAGGDWPQEIEDSVTQIAEGGGTPLPVAVEESDGTRRVIAVVQLSDVVKPGMAERFAELRQMGIKTIMVTGDNPLTAAAIAKEAGVDDYIAEATPEDKLARIREEQAHGRMVAMTGDGTNDAPALAQADVGVAMNTGTSAAKEAANMVDLDSDPTKLIDVVRIGKQLLITRGALTTFSLANDLAKYFAILPALFSTQLPHLERLNVMHLHSPQSAIVSAVVFNALIIVALIPLALKGVAYKPASASSLLRRNLGIWGLGGVITPFLGIWLIDQVVNLLPGM